MSDYRRAVVEFEGLMPPVPADAEFKQMMTEHDDGASQEKSEAAADNGGTGPSD